MVLANKINPVMRATLVISAVAVLVTGVTFALSSQATLAQNSFSVGSADLVLDVTSDADNDYVDSEPGFTFVDLLPGTPSAAYGISLRNQGDGPLDIAVHIPGPVTIPAGLDATKVKVKFEKVAGVVGVDREFSLAELIDTGDDPEILVQDVAANAVDPIDYNVRVLVQPDAVAGEGGVSVNNFDLVFTGTPPVPAP